MATKSKKDYPTILHKQFYQALENFNVSCGRLHGLEKGLVGGCGEPVNVAKVFACVDCTAPFHRKCLLKHIKEDMDAVSLSKMPLEEAFKKLDELNANKH